MNSSTDFNISGEAADDAVNSLRVWKNGVISPLGVGVLLLQWSERREAILKEWQEVVELHTESHLDDMLTTVGWYAAAAKRDVGFLAPLLEAMDMDEDLRDVLFGDIFFQDGAAFMALMASGSPDGIRALEEAALPTSEGDPLFNLLPLEALAILVADGRYARGDFDAVTDRVVRRVFELGLEKEDSCWLDWVISVVTYLDPGIQIEDFRRWFAQGLIQEGSMCIVNRDLVEKCAARKPGEFYAHWMALRSYHQIQDDVLEAMKWLEESQRRCISEKVQRMLSMDEADELSAVSPLAASASKVGRNDPCPCESGKKYKKCCGSLVK